MSKEAIETGKSEGTEKVTKTDQVEEAVTEGTTVTEPQDDNGKAARLESELSGYRKVMEVLGIDPESDVAQKVVAGVLSKDDLVSHIAPRKQAEAPQEAPVQETAAVKLQKLLDRVNSTDPTQDDFKESLQIISQLVNENEQSIQEQQRENVVSQCTRAMLAPIMDDKYHTQLPDNLREIEEKLFMGGTDLTVGSEARKSPNPQVYFNPKTYGFYADQNKKAYDQLREHYINLGRQMERGGKPRTTVEPVAPSTGGAPVEPPKQVVNLTNMRQMAQQYLQRVSQQ